MNLSEVNEYILSIFPIKSDVNLFEAYTEFWAEIINISFCSYFYTNIGFKLERNIETDKFNNFMTNVDFLLHYERIYSFFQLNKVLNYMGLTYKNLYSNNYFMKNHFE